MLFLKVCSNNYNVLYMQIWSSDVLLSQLNKNYCYNTNGELTQSQGSNSKNGQYLYVGFSCKKYNFYIYIK